MSLNKSLAHKQGPIISHAIGHVKKVVIDDNVLNWLKFVNWLI